MLVNNRVPKAVLFDVDGTLAETERDGHLVAFNRVFQALGIPWVWTDEDYQWLLKTTGGLERMRVYAQHCGQLQFLEGDGAQRLQEAHKLKNKLYAELVSQGAVKPRPGVAAFIQDLLQQGVIWTVVTTTSRANFDALYKACLKPAGVPPPQFAVCGEDVEHKKPDPEAYLQALHRLQLRPVDCLAVEDAPNGLKAARAAGIACLVVRSVYFQSGPWDGAYEVRDSFLS
ncbi:MAG: HAD-IA family hydrolase [Burkholderiaceae bacterium]|jgi:HAD superfamily hydrolase (TIGR01509 family)